MGRGLLEYAADMSICGEFCVQSSAVCGHFDHAGRAAIGRII